MPSATFDRVDVREIGLRSLVKLEIVGTLGKGGTLASFHTRGTLHSRKEVFKISAIGKARISMIRKVSVRHASIACSRLQNRTSL